MDKFIARYPFWSLIIIVLIAGFLWLVLGAWPPELIAVWGRKQVFLNALLGGITLGALYFLVAAGFTLQLDCPDLAMARHTGFQDLDDDQFLRRAAHHVEVLNHVTRNIDPARMRMHLCWGNYEGPHDHDIELAAVLPLVLAARPSLILLEAANPRHAHEWQVWESAAIPDDKVLVPGVITSTSNYVDHPAHVADQEHFVC